MQAPVIEPAPAATADPGPPVPKPSELPRSGVFEPGRLDELLPIGVTAVELTGRGNEPRRVIRPSLPKAARLALRVERGYGPMRYPDIVFEFAVVGSASGLDFAATAVRLPPDQPGVLSPKGKEMFATLAGLTIRSSFDAGGGTQVTSSLPPGVDEELEPIAGLSSDAISQLLIPFPRTPIGVGAFWEVADRTTFWGMAVLRTRLIELVRLYPIGLRVTASFFAESPRSTGQIGAGPHLDPDRVRLISLTGGGSCLFELDSSAALPVGESCTIVMKPEYGFAGEARGRTVRTKVETEIKIVTE